MSYLQEFLPLFLIHLGAVLMPGPDILIVISHSLSHGRRAGFLTGCGIGLGVFIHFTYVLMGFSFLFKTYPSVLLFFKIIGGCFLIYLSFKMWFKSKVTLQGEDTGSQSFFIKGLFTNLLNPNVPLFLVTVFYTFVPIDRSLIIQSSYALLLVLSAIILFSLIAILLSQPKIQTFYQQSALILQRCFAIILCGLALKLLFL